MVTAQQQGIKNLHHYQNLNPDHLRDTLLNNRVHFSSPHNFNDPWDCRPYFDVSTLSNPLVCEQWAKHLKTADLPEETQRGLEASLGPNWSTHPALLLPSIQRMSSHVWQNNGERWRIYCFTPKPNSVLMWSHYADKHKGICLEFGATGGVLEHAVQVIYRESLPTIGPDLCAEPLLLTETILLHKSTEWSYEEEYRFLARDSVADATFSYRTEADFLTLPSGCITSIVAGCNADIDAIRSLIADCAPKLNLKRAQRRGDRFEIESIDG